MQASLTILPTRPDKTRPDYYPKTDMTANMTANSNSRINFANSLVQFDPDRDLYADIRHISIWPPKMACHIDIWRTHRASCALNLHYSLRCSCRGQKGALGISEFSCRPGKGLERHVRRETNAPAGRGAWSGNTGRPTRLRTGEANRERCRGMIRLELGQVKVVDRAVRCRGVMTCLGWCIGASKRLFHALSSPRG